MSTAHAYQLNTISPEEYLDMEKDSPVKHEYIQGEILAMSGAADGHVQVSGNMHYKFKAHLRGTDCRVYMADMKVRVKKADAFFYPDVFITCDAADKKQNYYKDSPKLIAEVLSPSTEGYDRGSKFAFYREIESLEQYILIDPRELRVDVFTRNDANRWELVSYTGKETVIHLHSLNLEISMNELYEDVDFEMANEIV